jgi:hypothetical protein
VRSLGTEPGERAEEEGKEKKGKLSPPPIREALPHSAWLVGWCCGKVICYCDVGQSFFSISCCFVFSLLFLFLSRISVRTIIRDLNKEAFRRCYLANSVCRCSTEGIEDDDAEEEEEEESSWRESKRCTMLLRAARL